MAITNFYRQGKYRKSKCKDCTRSENAGWYSRLTDDQKARYKRTARAKKFGLTLEEYDDLLDGHERCPICLSTEPGGQGDWHIDHDHETGKVRGLLCSRCNLALGHLKDNVASMTRMQAYLEVHDALV